MASTPVSLKDESLEGSWIDVRSVRGGGDHSPDLIRQSPYSMVESVQSLGIISFQVERFLQEANNQRQAGNRGSANDNSQSQQSIADCVAPTSVSHDVNCTSPNCLSDTDASYDDLNAIAYMSSLRVHNRSSNNVNRMQQHQQEDGNITTSNNNIDLTFAKTHFRPHDTSGEKISKQTTGDYVIADQLSDSLSLLSRASAFGESSLQDFDWLWDWTAQPEYFTGQEWKIYAPKQDYLMRQRQLYCSDLEKRRGMQPYSGDMVSILFISNLLSIIIGAGLTYSILARRNGGL